MPRGSLARLEALETQASKRRAAVEAQKVAQSERAAHLLSRPDFDTLLELLEAQDMSGAWWDEVTAALEAVRGEPLPVGEAARAWWDAVCETPEGTPDPCPADPHAFNVYFEAEGRRCDECRANYEAGEPLPDGVRLLALSTGARWAGAYWRFMAALVREARP